MNTRQRYFDPVASCGSDAPFFPRLPWPQVVTDVFYDGHELQLLEMPVVVTANTHGTGERSICIQMASGEGRVVEGQHRHQIPWVE